MFNILISILFILESYKGVVTHVNLAHFITCDPCLTFTLAPPPLGAPPEELGYINISIRTTTGEPIKIGNDLAKIIIKLHFRKSELD